MIKNSLGSFSILAAVSLALPMVSWAATDGKSTVSGKDDKKTVTPIEKAAESCITGDIGVNVVSQYATRGVILENQGGITQPYADLYFRLYQGDGFLNKVQLNLGVWDSFNSRHTDAGVAEGHPHVSSTPNWYESDFTAGISITVLKNLTLTPSYFTFMSPNGGFNTFQGCNLKVAYDDTELLKGFALHPEMQVLWELDNKAGTGPSHGVYYEFGIAPAIPTGPLKDLSVTVPVTVGLGSHNFYGEVRDNGFLHQDNLGYFSAGLNFSYTLSFIPKCYGAWTVNTSATYYYLSNILARFNGNEAGPTNSGDIRHSGQHNECILSGGLAVAF